jgi:formylglycine-generating enzyme required for sulfatase activity
VAWFGAGEKDGPHPVGLKPANPWGLYDMHGNLAECVSDYFCLVMYEWPALPDPECTTECVCCRGGGVRGGHFAGKPYECCSFARNGSYQKLSVYGVRPVLVPEEVDK